MFYQTTLPISEILCVLNFRLQLDDYKNLQLFQTFNKAIKIWFSSYQCAGCGVTAVAAEVSSVRGDWHQHECWRQAEASQEDNLKVSGEVKIAAQYPCAGQH